ncbi:hypothetical protein Hanom_Chr02g00120141 [Helianthus anomalus]
MCKRYTYLCKIPSKKYNISSAWYLFDGCGDTGVTVSPTLGNFVPKFIRRSLFVTLPNNHQRYAK